MKKKTTRNKILDSQMKIYEITQKYDPTTTVYNYQDLSIYWIEFMTSLDRIRVKWYAKRTLRLTKKLNKENIK